jgi:predicted SAM-dependent methyltransferase
VSATRLNLGCSDRLMEGYENVDIAPVSDAVRRVDLNLPWPWEDSSIDEINAADIFEHIVDNRDQSIEEAIRYPRHWSGRIHVMNESWRVLKPGGILRMECPDAAKGCGQWQDPTHVTPWTPNGLQYFQAGSMAWARFHEAYGIVARFNVLECKETQYIEYAGSVLCVVWKFRAVLEAVK